MDEEGLDFTFVAGILRDWNPKEESDAALWKRMENTVCFPSVFLMFPGRLMRALSGPVPANLRGRRIVKNIGPCLKTTLRAVEK